MRIDRKREWFDDDAFWRELGPFMFTKLRFAEAVAQVGLALKLIRPKGKAALDLGCGAGRWAIPLAKRGFRVTGVDRTKRLLDQARARARAARVRVEWVRQDMRDFVRPEAFDLVLSIYTSFGYFDNKDEDMAVLKNIFASLRPGGSCLIDVAGTETLARIFQPTISDALPDGSRLFARNEVFDEWTRMKSEWTFVRQGMARCFQTHHTIYSGQALKERLEQAGFAGVKLYGNLDGTEYGSNAQRLIAVGRKPRAQRH